MADGTGDAVFVMFDGDMQSLLGVECSALVSAAKVFEVDCFWLFLCCVLVYLMFLR